jgi:hypothetical protein
MHSITESILFTSSMRVAYRETCVPTKQIMTSQRLLPYLPEFSLQQRAAMFILTQQRRWIKKKKNKRQLAQNGCLTRSTTPDRDKRSVEGRKLSSRKSNSITITITTTTTTTTTTSSSSSHQPHPQFCLNMTSSGSYQQCYHWNISSYSTSQMVLIQ